MAIRCDERRDRGGRSRAERTVMPRVAVLLLGASEAALADLGVEFAMHVIKPDAIPPGCCCVLVVAPTLRQPEVRLHLERIRRTRPWTPMALVTSADPANLRGLGGVSTEAVVAWERVREDLPDVVRSLCRRSPLEALAARFEQAAGVDPMARRALVTAVRAWPPPHTVKGRARVLGLPPNRLAEHFRPIKLQTGWSCLDLLHMVALWRVVEFMRNGRTVTEALSELGLDRMTVRRACRAQLACAPRELLRYAGQLERLLLEFADGCLGREAGRKD